MQLILLAVLVLVLQCIIIAKNELALEKFGDFMGRFVLAFALLFLIELGVIIKVGSAIGAFATITVLFAFMVIGAMLVKARFKMALLELQNNPNPSLQILWTPIAGFFFIFPGFISDIVALLLLLPPVQRMVMDLLNKKLHAHSMKSAGFSYSSSKTRSGSSESASSSGGRTIDATCTEIQDEEIDHK